MENINTKKIIRFLLFLFIILNLNFNLFGACCGDVQRGEGPYKCPNPECSWQRGDNRCNDDSECCPGMYCSSWGYCEHCR